MKCRRAGERNRSATERKEDSWFFHGVVLSSNNTQHF
jgi:hypothetical protein